MADRLGEYALNPSAGSFHIGVGAFDWTDRRRVDSQCASHSWIGVYEVNPVVRRADGAPRFGAAHLCVDEIPKQRPGREVKQCRARGGCENGRRWHTLLDQQPIPADRGIAEASTGARDNGPPTSELEKAHDVVEPSIRENPLSHRVR